MKYRAAYFSDNSEKDERVNISEIKNLLDSST